MVLAFTYKISVIRFLLCLFAEINSSRKMEYFDETDDIKAQVYFLYLFRFLFYQGQKFLVAGLFGIFKCDFHIVGSSIAIT